MAFDASQTLKDMLAAAQGVVAGEWPGVKDCAQQALEEQKEAIKEIADARLRGELTDEEFKSELEDCEATFEAALLACRVRAKATAQRAANAAIAVLREAIKVAA